MKVLKFGGSSVGSVDALRSVLKIINAETDKRSPIVVAVSALQGITDQLLNCANLSASGDMSWQTTLSAIKERHFAVVKEFLGQAGKMTEEKLSVLFCELEDVLRGIAMVKEASPRSKDTVASFGERLSAALICDLARTACPAAVMLDTREVIVTDANYGSARVNFTETNKRIRSHSAFKAPLVIATGFIGGTLSGETTTLGRGGSDYTAAILGAGLNSSVIEIWTDVDGVLTADPRKVKRAFSIPTMSYREAMELSHFGAKVIYPPTMQPAMDSSIPVWIKNTFKPEHPGSCISLERSRSEHAVTGISSLSQVALFRVEGSGMVGVAGISARLFGALARQKISVILISQASSEHSICFAILPHLADQARTAIREEFALELAAHLIDDPVVESNLAIVAVVGENMCHRPGIAGRMFAALAHNGINIVAIAQGSSELNISAVIASADESKALCALHDAFFLSGITQAHLYLLGSGGVASALLQQLAEHAGALRTSHRLELTLSGIANTRGFVGSPDGLPFALPSQLSGEGSKSPANLTEVVQAIEDHNLPASILVDCTASDEPPQIYERLLARGVSVVAANKRAGSGDPERYKSVTKATRLGRAKFLYEATVGAGLPVISTLHDLLVSGDRILRIEGLLSGTLGFLFSTFNGGKPFSDCVREAFDKGYTEPDPRDDLSGTDVARKLVILARDCGLARNLEDVTIESLVPESVRDSGRISDLFAALAAQDGAYAERLAKATSEGRQLRYLAVLTPDELSVGLKSIDSTSPFYSLSGADNMIVFTTERYRERPLVVRGPGAGRDVTAAAVFADILRAVPLSYL